MSSQINGQPPPRIYRFVFTEKGIKPLRSLRLTEGGSTGFAVKSAIEKKEFFDAQLAAVLKGCGDNQNWINSVIIAADKMYSELGENGLEELLMTEQAHVIQTRILMKMWNS